ncbi:MAG: hypothetical protein DME57_10615 [Verrucomicrobia bacterium]|nr:MAG: hypothetical protein DME57_10615 [Verrucomicrobiota bacterium]
MPNAGTKEGKSQEGSSQEKSEGRLARKRRRRFSGVRRTVAQGRGKPRQGNTPIDDDGKLWLQTARGSAVE